MTRPLSTATATRAPRRSCGTIRCRSVRHSVPPISRDQPLFEGPGGTARGARHSSIRDAAQRAPSGERNAEDCRRGQWNRPRPVGRSRSGRTDPPPTLRSLDTATPGGETYRLSADVRVGPRPTPRHARLKEPRPSRRQRRGVAAGHSPCQLRLRPIHPMRGVPLRPGQQVQRLGSGRGSGVRLTASMSARRPAGVSSSSVAPRR